MSILKSALISYILPIVAVASVVTVYTQSPDAKNLVCDQQFALCTSARCVPQPGDATKAICFCDVEDGKSMSTVPCNSVKPSTDVNGIRTIYSAFALKQFQAGLKGLKCPDG